MQPETEPDVAWVAALAATDEPSARAAVAEASRERRLYAHLAREHAREGRASYIEIDAPLELYALVRLLRPHHVVEVGVSSGVSSAYLLAALQRNGAGTLHSVDLPSYPRRTGSPARPSRWSWTLPPGRGTGWAVPQRLRGSWDLRIGDKADVLPMLASQIPRVDLFVYDVPHEDRRSRDEFRALDPKVAPGGVAIVDHGHGGGLCSALAAWATSWGAAPTGRAGLGLYGVRRPVGATARRRSG